jgi:hypothetical protein
VADHCLKRGDVLPSHAVTFSGGSGRTLTGATVVYVLKKPDGTVLSRNAAVVEDATLKQVRYDFVSADTLTNGDRFGEWEVTYSDLKVETFPVGTYEVIRVRPDLR